MRSVVLFTVLFFAGPDAFAQITQHSGWLFYTGAKKLGAKFGVQADLNLRSGDGWNYLRQFIIRPGVTFQAAPNRTLAAGLTLANTQMDPDLKAANPDRKEIGAWLQFIRFHRPKRITGFHRFRLEPRFNELANGDLVFNQRFRYLARYIFPLQKGVGAFAKGPFAALQQETFFAIQNRTRLNLNFLDQNRLLGGLGYRYSPKGDIELAYVRQSINGTGANTTNNIVQVGVYNRF